MSFELSLYRDAIAPAARFDFAPPASTVRAVYVVSGGLRVETPAIIGALAANSALLVPNALEIRGGSLASVALRWELTPAGAPAAPLRAEGASGELLLRAPLALDRAEPYLLRCDRVDFPPGGEALTHTHRGGGIRCLLAGTIEIDTLGARHGYRPLEAWFEAGPHPVYAAASATQDTAFARVMILPRALLGKPSISYVNTEDLARPKSQRYQVFIDAPVELPAAV
ncbi:MAG TPA: hypothetical protein VMK05_13340 [Burkholderiales bacterium]|nr:hypothetical protein [Burkholderiales bacterium]